MSYLGSYKVDDYLTFCCNTHDPDTGVATDADSVPTYRVYEDETATPILTGSTALLDAANTAGFYSERIQLTAANGLEKGKCYTIYITATVDGDTGTMHHNFQIEAEVDANTVSASNVSANVAQIEGADPTDTIRDSVVDDATRIDASALNALSGHDPGGTLCLDATPLTAAETESEVNDALVALHIDHLLAVDYDPASPPGTATALLNELVESDVGVSRLTANALEQGPDTTTALTLHSDYDAAKTAAPASEYDTEMGRITANVALASVCTETRLAELDAANLPTDIADVPTVAEFNARTQPTADYFDPAADTVAEVTLVTTTTTNTDMRGTDNAALASGVNCTQVEGGDATDAIQAAADAALVANHLDHLLAADYDPASQPGVATALFNELIESDAGVSRFTANALEEAPTGGSAPTVEEIRTEIDSNSTQLAAIVADTNELQTDDVPGLIAALNDVSTAEVNTQVDTALSDIHLDHLLAVDYDPTSKPGTATALLNELVESDAGVSRFTENALEQAPSGTGASAATIADAVWDEAAADHVAAGSFGVQAGTDIDAILADTNELQTDDVPSLIAALNDPTAAAIRTEIDSNSTQLAAIVADTNELQTDDIPGLISALNDPTATAIRTEMDSNSTQLAAIVADTNELQTDDIPGAISGLNDPTAAAVRTEMDSNSTQLAAVVADTNELQTDDVPGLIAALNDIAVTDVTQRQIPDSVPADGTLPTLEQALYMIVQRLYEAEVIDTTMTVKKVDGSTALLTLTLNDATDPTSITRAT